MDEATFRILDTLTREIGSTISINQLTSKIRQYYGTAYYARTYNKLNDLLKQGFITITKAGRSSVPSLNFSNYLLSDLLSEIEMRKKREFLGRSKTLQPFIKDVEAYARRDSPIESISLIKPERNARLNRAELLTLIRDSKKNGSSQVTAVYRAVLDLQSKHNVRADVLPLSTEELAELLASDEINPLREMLSNKIAFHAPQAFWAEIASSSASGHRIRLLSTDTNPAKITEKDLVFNLTRFGYEEIGPKIAQGEKICIEYIITSILMKGDARRINSIPILLSKNTTNYNLLIFLSQKSGLTNTLLGLLKVMGKIKPQKKVTTIVDTLEELNTKEINADANAVSQNMRSYNAVG